MIVLGITGSIAAYKSIDVIRRLSDEGKDVRVVMTPSAAEFVTPLTFRTMSGSFVATSMFEKDLPDPLYHIRLAEEAELFLIAPATADFIAKMAHGIADDLLSTLVLAARCQVYVAPAMNTNMLLNPATQKNIEILRDRGVRLIGPVGGKLAEGAGEGRMSEPVEIVEILKKALIRRDQMKGLKVVVTAGGTREPIDAARFIGNYSSGKMGFAIAEEAASRGASVTLICGATELPVPAGTERIDAEKAEDMLKEVERRAADADIIVMAAAVADLKPKKANIRKLKKDDLDRLELVKTPDILKRIAGSAKRAKLIGFSAETEDLSKNAREKLAAKGLDMIVANDIGRKDIAFGSDFNQVVIIKKDGQSLNTARMRKRDIAEIILDQIKTV